MTSENRLFPSRALSILIAATFAFAPLSQTALAAKTSKSGDSKNPMVLISTSMGDIKIQLNPEKAPISVKNFLEYVKEKHYDGTIFHRVIPNFMIQGGGLNKDLKPAGKTRDPIKNEAGNGLKNEAGTLAMARTNVVDSATDQFYINAVDNAFLDHRDDSPQGFGYAVFGKVTEGMDVVHKIEHVQTTNKDGMGDVPVDTVTIKSIRVIKK